MIYKTGFKAYYYFSTTRNWAENHRNLCCFYCILFRAFILFSVGYDMFSLIDANKFIYRLCVIKIRLNIELAFHFFYVFTAKTLYKATNLYVSFRVFYCNLVVSNINIIEVLINCIVYGEAN